MPIADPRTFTLRLTGEEAGLLEALKVDNGSQVFKDALALLARADLPHGIPLYARSVFDADVEEKVEEAVKAACDVLADLFPRGPGVEHRGISSNFQGTLVEHVQAMLCGLGGAKNPFHREMNTLLADWKAFGRLRQEEVESTGRLGFTVMRFGRGAPDLFMNPDSGAMVPLNRIFYGTTCIGQSEATAECLKQLALADRSPRQERLHLVALVPSEDLHLLPEPLSHGIARHMLKVRMAEKGPKPTTPELIVVAIADIPGESGMTGEEYLQRTKPMPAGADK